MKEETAKGRKELAEEGYPIIYLRGVRAVSSPDPIIYLRGVEVVQVHRKKLAITRARGMAGGSGKTGGGAGSGKGGAPRRRWPAACLAVWEEEEARKKKGQAPNNLHATVQNNRLTQI